jgi:two-component system nitrate/nitrite response regulator NarL
LSRRFPEVDALSTTTIHAGEIGSAEKIRTLIVSNVRIYRDALAAQLDQHDRIAVVGAVGHDGAVRDVNRLEPGLVLLDVGEWYGLELATTFLTQRPELEIVAIAVPEIAGATIAAMWRGIAGFVARDGSIEDVISELERLTAYSQAEPITLAPPAMVPNGIKPVVAARSRTGDLTRRECEILEMIELGLSNKEIARDLRIEVGTVKNHVHNILEKLNVSRRNQAAHRVRVRIRNA